MKESLELTQQRAIERSKKYGQLEAVNSNKGNQQVTNTIDGLTRVTASLELDRQVVLSSIGSGRDNFDKAEKQGLSANVVDEADIRALKRAASILKKVEGASGWLRAG